MTGIVGDLARAEAMLAVGRHDEAASLLALVVAFQPGDSRVWCLLARAHLGAGRYRDAAEAASQAVVAAPSYEWAYRLVSVAQSHLGNAKAAMEAARQACRLAPDEWQTWHCLASAALASDLTFGVGEQAAAKARMLAPDKAEVYYVSGRVAYMFSKWKEARTFQEQALALDPAHSGALNELGRISMQRWNHARAADHFLQAAGSSPKAGVYSYNVHAAVWQPICRLMTLTMLSTYALSAAAIDHPSIAVPGLSAIALLSAVLGVARFWKFPPAARVLLHTMRVVLVLSVAYGSVVGAIIIAAAIPAPSQAGTYAILGPTGVTTMCLVYVAVYTTRLKGKLTSSP